MSRLLIVLYGESIMSKSINLRKIRVLFSDVDGTLTDGSILYDAHGEALKVFNAHDGYGIKLWMAQKLEFGLLSGKQSDISLKRGQALGIHHIILGVEDKCTWMHKWLSVHDYTWDNLAYIGDDLNDLEVIQQAYYTATPSDGVAKLKEHANYICQASGGRGALREFIDLLLEHQ